jgi:hypothetical protein
VRRGMIPELTTGCHDTSAVHFLKVFEGFWSIGSNEEKCQNTRHFPMFFTFSERTADITDSIFSPSLYLLSYLSLAGSWGESTCRISI